MKPRSPKTTSKVASRKNCGICRKLPSSSSYDVFQGCSGHRANFSHLESFENFLESRTVSGLSRCPICHTFYLETGESDPHHFMSYEISIARISAAKARGILATMLASHDRMPIDADKARLWMGKHNVESYIATLGSKLETSEAADAATSLAEIYFRQEDWSEFEALLRHRNSRVRGGALCGLPSSLEGAPAKIIKALVDLLEDKTHARKAHDAFNNSGFVTASPVILTFVECLEHKNPKVRAMAVDSILHHLEPDSGYYIDKDGNGSYRAPKHPKLDAKTAKALLSRLPPLIEYLIKPRPARWVNIDANPYSEIARNTPKKLTTAVGASRVLNSLINRNKTSKACVRKALKAASPRLQKMFANNEFGDLDLDVYFLAQDVSPDK